MAAEMHARLTLVVLLLAAGPYACGSGSKSSPSSGSTQQISGTEQLAWDQRVASRDEIAKLRFVALVDGRRSELPDTHCRLSTASVATYYYDCRSSLPSMSAGLHSIQLIALNGTLESPPSAPPLSVNLGGAPASNGSSSAGSSASTGAGASDSPTPGASDSSVRIATSDGVSLRIETLASGLNDVTDLALAPSGWVLVAERAGRIRSYRDRAVQPDPAAVLGETLAAGGELLAIAVDPQFDPSRWVYAVHTTAVPTGITQAVARVPNHQVPGECWRLGEPIDAPCRHPRFV